MELTAAIVGPAHGLRGEVYLDIRTDDPAGRFTSGATFPTDSKEFPKLTLETARTHKNRVLARFAEAPGRDEAERLRGTRLMVEAAPEDDAWYPHELEGLRAVTPTGTELGTVEGLQAGAAQDLLLVKSAADGRTVMVPFVEDLVPEVSPDRGEVVIDAPAGLFDDESAEEAR